MHPPKSVITFAVIGTEILHIQKKNAIPPNELAGPIIRPHNMEPKENYDLTFINVKAYLSTIIISSASVCCLAILKARSFASDLKMHDNNILKQ